MQLHPRLAARQLSRRVQVEVTIMGRGRCRIGHQYDWVETPWELYAHSALFWMWAYQHLPVCIGKDVARMIARMVIDSPALDEDMRNCVVAKDTIIDLKFERMAGQMITGGWVPMGVIPRRLAVISVYGGCPVCTRPMFSSDEGCSVHGLTIQRCGRGHAWSDGSVGCKRCAVDDKLAKLGYAIDWEQYQSSDDPP